MRATVLLVEQEFRSRWPLLAAALLLGVLAWLAAWLPRVQHFDPAEVRSGTALIMSAAFLVGAALYLSSSMISRDLAEGRLAFYYTRPIGAGSLWCGKLASVLLLLSAAAFLLWLPTLLSGGTLDRATDLLFDWPESLEIFQAPSFWRSPGGYAESAANRLQVAPIVIELGPFWAWVALCFPALILLTHALSTALRARSPRIAVDLLLLAVVVALGLSASARLITQGALGTLYRAGMFLAIGILGIFFTAGLIQTACGRTSPIRAYASLQVALWALLLPLAAGYELRTRQVVRADFEDLASVTHLSSNPTGEWWLAGGPARNQSGYAPMFAIHAPSGEKRKIDVLPAVCDTPVFSADGRAVVWESAPLDQRWGDCEVSYLELGKPEPPLATGIRSRSPHANRLRSSLALSRDGQRMAVVDDSKVAIYSLPTGETVAAARLPLAEQGAPRFVSEKVRLHLPHWSEQELEIWEFDPGTLELSNRGRLEGINFTYSVSGDRLAVWSARRETKIFRTADLVELAQIFSGIEKRTYAKEIAFLEDSGVVMTEAQDGSTRIRQFDAAGEELWSLDLPQSRVFLGVEPEPGRLWVGIWHWQKEKREASALATWTSRLLDLESGRATFEIPGAVPNWSEARPLSLAARALLGEDGRPFLVDEQGDLEKLLF